MKKYLNILILLILSANQVTLADNETQKSGKIKINSSSYFSSQSINLKKEINGMDGQLILWLDKKRSHFTKPGKRLEGVDGEDINWKYKRAVLQLVDKNGQEDDQLILRSPYFTLREEKGVFPDGKPIYELTEDYTGTGGAYGGQAAEFYNVGNGRIEFCFSALSTIKAEWEYVSARNGRGKDILILEWGANYKFRGGLEGNSIVDYIRYYYNGNGWVNSKKEVIKNWDEKEMEKMPPSSEFP